MSWLSCTIGDLMSVDTCVTDGKKVWKHTEYYFKTENPLSAFLDWITESETYAIRDGSIFQTRPLPRHARTPLEGAPSGSAEREYSLPVLLASIHGRERRIQFSNAADHPELWDAYNYLDIEILMVQGQRAGTVAVAEQV